MNDLLNLNENSNESNLNSLDDIITNNANKMNQEENLNQNQDNVMKGIDDIIVHNSENLGSINVDISDKE